ncbi:MAG: glycosyltransferase family 4 protein [Chlorobia bacterium]|nr:glycosyltransferase family 4 protein [Fimbriimonadaceae bacterium]
MKVLQVASSLYDWGGIERYVHYLDEGLTGRSHSVTVVCPPGSPLEQRSAKKAIFANKGQFSARTYLAYRLIGRETKPDIAHIHFSPDFIMPALALRQTCRAKIIMTRHLVLPWSPSKVRRYTKLFDHIIPVSGAVERKLAESGVPEAMMTVAKAGVPDPAIEPAPLLEGPPRVGAFGRLVKEKGFDVLIQAATMAPDIHVDIYGSGPAESELKALAVSTGVQDRITFHGQITDVAAAMNQVDLICVPSVWDEAFPYSILEAMAMARSVVASRVGGVPEVVQEGVTGRLFERQNHQELASILKEFGNDRTRLVKMGGQGREVQQAEYTIPKMAERIEAVYRKVLG